MVNDDPYRFCIYCEADCYEDEPEHAADCPSTTGVYPVRLEDLGPPCPHCGEPTLGFGCVDCGAQLQPGDHYMHRILTEGDSSLPDMEGASLSEVICVGCAAKEALA